MKKVVMIILLLSSVYCNKNEPYKNGKYIKFPDELYAINFCNIQLDGIIESLKIQKVIYKTFDCNGKEIEIKSTEHNSKILLCSVESPLFIGNGFEKSKIANVYYMHIPPSDRYMIVLKYKIEYYNELLETLSRKFGDENAYINIHKYGEILWKTDPDYKIKTCISQVTISKKIQYDTSETVSDFCYLTIETRGKDTHVH